MSLEDALRQQREGFKEIFGCYPEEGEIVVVDNGRSGGPLDALCCATDISDEPEPGMHPSAMPGAS